MINHHLLLGKGLQISKVM